MAAGATIAIASQLRRSQAGSRVTAAQAGPSHTSSRVSTMTVETTSSTSVVAVIAALAAGSDSRANGAKTIAASGG